MGKLVYLTEKQYKEYLKLNTPNKCVNVLRKTISNNYTNMDKDSIGMPFDVYLNECCFNETLYCYAPYQKDETYLKQYKVMYDDKPKKTLQDEYMRLFINNNMEAIRNVAEMKYDFSDFYNSVVKIINNGIIDQDKYLISEMSQLRRNITGLPTDIWVDECGTYKKCGHYQRLKFNPNNGEKNTRNFPSITLDDEMNVINNNKCKINLSNNDIDKIKQFIVLNKDLLLSMGDGKIKKDTEFIPLMTNFDIKSGKIKKPLMVYGNDNDINYTIENTNNFNYSLVSTIDSCNNKKYNIIDNNKNTVPIFNVWMDKLTNFFKRGNLIVAIGVVNNKQYDCFTDGIIKPI